MERISSFISRPDYSSLTDSVADEYFLTSVKFVTEACSSDSKDSKAVADSIAIISHRQDELLTLETAKHIHAASSKNYTDAMALMISRPIPLTMHDVLKTHELVGANGVIERCGVLRKTGVRMGNKTPFVLPSEVEPNMQGVRSTLTHIHKCNLY